MGLTEESKALTAAIMKSRKLMLREKALHGERVVVGDGNGGVTYIDAAQFLKEHPEFN